MVTAETLMPLSVSVSQAVFTMGIAKERDPVPVSPGVTWKRTI